MAAFPNVFFTDSVGSSETGFQGTGLQDAENIKGEGCVVSLGPESVVLDEGNQILDMATSAVSYGKIRVALHEGRPAPVGALIDAQGRPTTDPAVRTRATSGGNARVPAGSCVGAVLPLGSGVPSALAADAKETASNGAYFYSAGVAKPDESPANVPNGCS